MSFAGKKLIILDRDGVINHDSPNYIKSVDEWQPITGSLQAIKQLNDAGKLVAVATNQSGIARGLFSLATLEAMHAKMTNLLAAESAHVDAIVYCPHGPDDACACRKPLAGMLQQLLQQFHLDVSQALLIGDSYRDLQAAMALGMDAILVKTGKGEQTLQQHALAVPVYADLQTAVKALLHD